MPTIGDVFLRLDAERDQAVGDLVGVAVEIPERGVAALEMRRDRIAAQRGVLAYDFAENLRREILGELYHCSRFSPLRNLEADRLSETDDDLGDDVALHFRRAAENRVGAAVEIFRDRRSARPVEHEGSLSS